MLVLHLLLSEDLYGYRMIQLFNEKSGGRYTMLEGTLYTVLFRLEKAGYVSDYTVVVGKKRTRHIYRITDSGRAYLDVLKHEYEETLLGVNLILDKAEEN